MGKLSDINKEIKSISNEEKIYIELLAEIVDAREEMNVTQRGLADISGLKQPAIARLERPNGQNVANLLTVIKYLDALGMKLKVVPKEDSKLNKEII
jgi:predicted transcriptional regulator